MRGWNSPSSAFTVWVSKRVSRIQWIRTRVASHFLNLDPDPDQGFHDKENFVWSNSVIVLLKPYKVHLRTRGSIKCLYFSCFGLSISGYLNPLNMNPSYAVYYNIFFDLSLMMTHLIYTVSRWEVWTGEKSSKDESAFQRSNPEPVSPAPWTSCGEDNSLCHHVNPQIKNELKIGFVEFFLPDRTTLMCLKKYGQIVILLF
jgi:hypothetical protein